MALRVVPAVLAAIATGANALVYAAHPLITEDTGTQGAGRNQLELTLERGYDTADGISERSWEYTLVATHGLTDTVDFIASVPYARVRTDAGAVTTESGVGDVGVDLKWRFYEAGRLSLALKPGVSLPTGDEASGLGTGRAGYGGYVVASIDLAPWAIHVHAGYLRHRNTLGEREGLRHFSLAAWRDFGRLRVVADIGKNTAADSAAARDPAFMIGGVIYALSDDIDLDAGYKKGISSTETDGTWLAGVALRF